MTRNRPPAGPAQHGPVVSEVMSGLDEVPKGATSLAFMERATSNV